MKLSHSLVVASLVSLFTLSAAQGADASLSPDEESQLRELMTRKYRAAILNGGMLPQARPQSATMTASTSRALPMSTLNEAALAKSIVSMKKPAEPLFIEQRVDGFLVNGAQYLDPEGKIISFAYNIFSGDITYLVEQSPSVILIKYVKALSGAEPITIAQGQQTQNGWQVRTVTGKTLVGEGVIPTSCGFLVSRTNTAFRYVPGSGITNISAPNGFEIAAFQNGDVAATDFILLERVKEKETGGDVLGNLGRSFARIGATLGASKKEDYVLYNVKTGQTFPLDVSNDGKTVSSMSNCRRKNRYVNVCSNVISRDSLYSKDGSPNIFHYFWRIHWFQTENGPIMIAHEKGVSEINITDLVTGKKVNAFQRGMGIASYNAKQQPNGKIRIEAQIVFERVSIDDARKALDTRPAVVELAEAAK